MRTIKYFTNVKNHRTPCIFVWVIDIDMIKKVTQT